jgi:HlyD family secretion protein
VFVNGLNGQADIVTEEHKDVLAVPQDAIREDGTVYIKEGNEYKTVKVETGLSSDSDIEIKSGLTEGQEVVKNPSSVIPPSKNPITRFIQSLMRR